ncbi:MAG: hypothetical protein F4X36_09930 [Gammaproteobacteria bacterium]|nr:hypothetical protein [Gammaproteobacteria bacterium]
MPASRWFGAGAGALAAVAIMGAATVVTSAEIEQTDVRASAVEGAAARAWNLDETDLARYRTLMAGRRGLWTPDADPLLVLGAHARSHAERRRFAEAYVAAEWERVEGELAFERAVGEAWARLHGDEALFASAPSPDPVEGTAVRFAVALDADCVPCRSLAERYWGAGAPVDFHVLGTGGRDAALVDWVRALDVDVSRPGITVNHGDRFEGEAVPLVLAQALDGAWRELGR